MPKAVAQWRCEAAGASGCANHGEARQIKPDAASGWPLANHNIKLEVFHGGIEHLFDRARKAVNFVNKQDVAILKVGQNASEVARALNCWPRGNAKSGAHLVGDDACHGGFAEPWWAIEQYVVNWFAALFGGVDGELQVALHPWLANVVSEGLRPQCHLSAGFFLRLVCIWLGRRWFDKSLNSHNSILTLALLEGEADLFADWQISRHVFQEAAGIVEIKAERDEGVEGFAATWGELWSATATGASADFVV